MTWQKAGGVNWHDVLHWFGLCIPVLGVLKWCISAVIWIMDSQEEAAVVVTKHITCTLKVTSAASICMIMKLLWLTHMHVCMLHVHVCHNVHWNRPCNIIWQLCSVHASTAREHHLPAQLCQILLTQEFAHKSDQKVQQRNILWLFHHVGCHQVLPQSGLLFHYYR